VYLFLSPFFPSFFLGVSFCFSFFTLESEIEKEINYERGKEMLKIERMECPEGNTFVRLKEYN